MSKSAATPSTDQFETVKFHGHVAFKGLCAVLDADGSHVALVAPDMNGLEEVWQRLHRNPLDRDKVQYVLILGRKP